MRIEKLSLQQIAVFEENMIEFLPCPNSDKAEIHIFTGQNGSGKSTILYALASAFRKIEKHYATNSINRFHKRFKYFEGNCEKNCKSEAFIHFQHLPFVQVYGCSSCKFIHTKTENSWIKNYSSLIDGIIDSNKILSFAAFAYSGYRFIERETINMISEARNLGIKGALEFIKEKEDNTLSLNQCTNLEKDFLSIAKRLAAQSTELNTIVQMEIRQINRIKATHFAV